jgi:hypothetical protein
VAAKPLASSSVASVGYRAWDTGELAGCIVTIGDLDRSGGGRAGGTSFCGGGRRGCDRAVFRRGGRATGWVACAKGRVLAPLYRAPHRCSTRRAQFGRGPAPEHGRVASGRRHASRPTHQPPLELATNAAAGARHTAARSRLQCCHRRCRRAEMNFKFSNLLGAPYRGGNFVLSDQELLSPVGNRVSQVRRRAAAPRCQRRAAMIEARRRRARQLGRRSTGAGVGPRRHRRPARAAPGAQQGRGRGRQRTHRDGVDMGSRPLLAARSRPAPQPHGATAPTDPGCRCRAGQPRALHQHHLPVREPQAGEQPLEEPALGWGWGWAGAGRQGRSAGGAPAAPAAAAPSSSAGRRGLNPEAPLSRAPNNFPAPAPVPVRPLTCGEPAARAAPGSHPATSSSSTTTTTSTSSTRRPLPPAAGPHHRAQPQWRAHALH